MIKKRGLGKGIGALIPDFDDSVLDKKEAKKQKDLFFAPIDEIITNPNQPRKTFSEEAIKELSLSIKEKGVLQPLLVKKAEKGFELIAGERRLRAAHKAGLLVVPVILKEVDEKTSQEIALMENIQRKDLNVLEEAEAYQSLIKRYRYTQEDVSKKLGKNRTVITNALRLLKLSETIKKDLPEGFQTSEFLLEHGFLDFIVDRSELREKLSDLLYFFDENRTTQQLSTKHKAISQQKN